MQSTGQARAHLSHPMQVVRSNRWNPRYRGLIGTGRSGYAKWDVNGLRRNVWTKVHNVTYMPAAMVVIASRTFRSHARIGETKREVGTGIISARSPPAEAPAQT